MKKYTYRNRNALVLVATFLLFAMAGLSSIRAADGPARLVVHRIANLGNNLIVQLQIDGRLIPITYGRTYAGALSPGRHDLALAPAPNAKWKTPWHMSLDAQGGRTYNFTVVNGGSGLLVLKRD